MYFLCSLTIFFQGSTDTSKHEGLANQCDWRSVGGMDENAEVKWELKKEGVADVGCVRPKTSRLKHLQVNKYELKREEVEVGVDSWSWLMEKSWGTVIWKEIEAGWRNGLGLGWELDSESPRQRCWWEMETRMRARGKKERVQAGGKKKEESLEFVCQRDSVKLLCQRWTPFHAVLVIW